MSARGRRSLTRRAAQSLGRRWAREGSTSPTPGIAIGVSPTTATVTEGASATLTVTVTRTGAWAGAVDVIVSGLPAGVTVSALTIGSGATVGTLTLSAALGATLGAATLTVTATGAGVANATATVSLTVGAAVGGGTFTVSLRAWNLDPTLPSGSAGQRFRGSVPLLLSDAVTPSTDPTRFELADTAAAASLAAYTAPLKGETGPIWHAAAPKGADRRYSGTDADRPTQALEVEVTIPTPIPFGAYRDVLLTGHTTRNGATLGRAGHTWAANGLHLTLAADPRLVRLASPLGYWVPGEAAPRLFQPQDLPIATQVHGQGVTTQGVGVGTWYVRLNLNTGGLVVSSGLNGVWEDYPVIGVFQVTTAAPASGFTWGVDALNAAGVTFTPPLPSAALPTVQPFNINGIQTGSMAPRMPTGLLCLAPSEAARACASQVLGAGAMESLPLANIEARGAEYADTRPSLASARSYHNANLGYWNLHGLSGLAVYEPGLVPANEYVMAPSAEALVGVATATWASHYYHTAPSNGSTTQEQFINGLHQWAAIALLADDGALARLDMSAKGATWTHLVFVGGARGYNGARGSGRAITYAAAALRARLAWKSTWDGVTAWSSIAANYTSWSDVLGWCVQTAENAMNPTTGRVPESNYYTTTNTAVRDDRYQIVEGAWSSKPLMTGHFLWGMAAVLEEGIPNLAAGPDGAALWTRAKNVLCKAADWAVVNGNDGPASGRNPSYTQRAGWYYVVENSWWETLYKGGTPTHGWNPALNGGAGAWDDSGAVAKTHRIGDGEYGGVPWDTSIGEGLGGNCNYNGTMFAGLGAALAYETDATKRARLASALDFQFRRSRRYRAVQGTGAWQDVNGFFLGTADVKNYGECLSGYGRGARALATYAGW